MPRRAPARTPQVVATFPFTEDRKRETVIVSAAGGVLAVTLAVTKGAPETIVALCDEGSGDLLNWRERVEALARDGPQGDCRRPPRAAGSGRGPAANPTGASGWPASWRWRTRCAPASRRRSPSAARQASTC